MLHLTPIETRLVCWTRMQSEAGQTVGDILTRKEQERRAGGGLFFWGVGNAPSRAIRRLAEQNIRIHVVFSLMRSKPKQCDAAPKGVLVWRSYYDGEGIKQPIPPHVLVTSRSYTGAGLKTSHYALICHSDHPLAIADFGSFDPSAYRNLSDAGSPVGSSQVTALLLKVRDERHSGGYRVNFRARLMGSYWVRLADPYPVDEWPDAELSSYWELTNSQWIDLVTQIRGGSCSGEGRTKRQNLLF